MSKKADIAHTAPAHTDELTGADRQAFFKPISDELVRSLTDAGSFSKGQQYYRNGYLLDAVLRGPILRGKCRGSSGGPYNVDVELSAVKSGEGGEPRGAKASIVSYSCNCPRGGFCKHVVALLLLWVHEPEAVEVREELEALLKDRNREELAALVAGMLRRAPDLEQWVDTMLATTPSALGTPGASAAAPGQIAALNPAKIKRQVAAIFGGRNYEWGEAGDIAGQLGALLDIADRYAEAGQPGNAQVVYGAVADKTLEEYDTLEDEEGEVSGVVTDCGVGLKGCLEAPAGLSPEARLDSLKTLYAVWEQDTDYGSWPEDESIPELIARVATAEELAQVESWVRADLAKSAEGSYGNYGRLALVGFLLDLKGDSLSDEEVLAEYRNVDLYGELPAVLLAMGRGEEAVRLAAKHLASAHEVTHFADSLLALNGEWQGRALAFVEDRQWEEKDPRTSATLLRWLEEHYISLGMQEQALKTSTQRFKSAPSRDAYNSVKKAALMPDQSPDLWAATRPDLLAALGKANAHRDLIEIYLEEGEVAQALAALAREEGTAGAGERPGTRGWGGYQTYFDPNDYRLRLARAAEKDYPGEAATIYRRTAEQLIEARNRGSYSQAAELLGRVKELYKKQQKEAEWQAYILELRARHKSLRALREELDLLGLG